MPLQTIFDICRPRPDVLDSTVADEDFAADLAQVLTGTAGAGYREPGPFFANTYPTRGLKNLLANVCRRLSGAGDAVGAIFRLDTSYGGGKTHGLIALAHAARGMTGVSDVGEFIDPGLLPAGPVRVAAFDGENADPANGRALDGGVLAYTPWGEVAHALAGKPGYERVRRSDEQRVAPGAETLRALFGDAPTLILLDELSVYLRKVSRLDDARGQLTAFLTSLFKAAESTPNAALVYTLAIGKDGRTPDAYSTENQFVADRMAEIESVSARKATLLNPTEEDETVQVLRRRLFEHIDDARAAKVVAAYHELWTGHQDAFAGDAARPETVDQFRASYPLHPHVLETLTGKTATLANFQRVRGMLRLLARTVAHLWRQRPADATAIHLHHIDPGHEPIRQEIVTRLGQSAFVPAITNDIAAGRVDQRALAEEIDAEQHQGLPPYAAYVARTIFMHTLAFNDPLKGLTAEELRYAAAGPAVDPSFIDEARKRFTTESAYLDDRPAAPMRFLAEANLSVVIRREEQHVDPAEARAQLNDRIQQIFSGKTFEAVPFPGGPFDVPDEVGDGRPKLVVFAYDGVAVGEVVDEVPELIERAHTRKGADGSALRVLRNHVVFVAADERASDGMRRRMRSRLALRRLKEPDRLVDLANHQQEKIRDLEARSEQELAIAIQQCYRHVFYPSRDRIGTRGAELAHTAIDIPSASNQPGAGQQQIARALRDLKKLRLAEDEPDAPTYVRDRTPLRKGQMTTLALRDEFRRDPTLPMLVGDDIFIRGIRRGIEQGDYVYRRGDLLFGPGDPPADIRINEQAVVMTMAYAKNKGVWPRQKPKPEPPGPGPTPPGPDPPTPPGPGPTPPGPSPGPAPGVFSAEGVLKDALAQLWEQARAKKAAAIGTLTIRMFEAGDAFRLLGAVGAVSSAEKVVALTGGYETRDGGAFELTFRGPVQDAQPVKEFLEPQLRAAQSRTVEARFELSFTDGLAMDGDAAETLANGLCRFASGAGYAARQRFRAHRGTPRPKPGTDRTSRVAAVGPSRHPARSIREPQETGIRAGGGRGAHAGVALPGARAHAQPRQHAGGGRRHRGDGARGGRLLARHGDASPAPSARADGAAGAVDRAVGWPASPPFQEGDNFKRERPHQRHRRACKQTGRQRSVAPMKSGGRSSVEGRIESLIQGRVRSRGWGGRIGNQDRTNWRSHEEKTRQSGSPFTEERDGRLNEGEEETSVQLKAFRVQKFRNIENSGEVELLDALTCVVGKNQAGKSALLRALHKFNPHLSAPYDMRREWPRGQRTQRNKKQVVCEVRFTLSPEELKKLGEIAGQELSGVNVVVTKDYEGNFEIQFPKDSTLFPRTLHPNSIDAICQNLPEPTEPVGENFRAEATKCILEAKQYAKDGRFEELTRRVRARHAAALQKQLTEGNIDPQRTNENQFIGDYKEKLTEVKAKLVAERTKHQKAQDYIVSQLPTFIYMDDYKAFRGRADLEGLKERLSNKKLALSEEDETFLMILKLGGLDLDNLIKQGESRNQNVIHDRQIDLQDSATTLTHGVTSWTRTSATKRATS